ncbi:hypothetical protein K438DRAFT_1993752 [Mycena galopus ATCC 62051]|nr:hypothetical protein K438DRAFT_1993752 [Mycena galopus ATCC 62051]
MRTKIGVVEDTAGVMEEVTRWYQENLPTSVVRMDPDFGYQLGYSLLCELDTGTGDEIEAVVGPTPKISKRCALEKCTNHDGLNRPPDDWKLFLNIIRQWREVKRGHKESRPGWNLPDRWENINLLYQFIYWLFLAQDANFRLSNHNLSSEIADPILGDSLGFFCKQEGPEGYKPPIAKHVDEAEILNCSRFQAMFMANTKRTKGLRMTGAHPKAEESPFELAEEVTILCEIQLAIATEEFICMKEGTEIKCEHSPGACVMMGMELEEAQRKLEIDIRALKDPSVAQTLAFTKNHTALLRQIHKFQMYDGSGDQLPEATRLFMPLELSASVCAKVRYRYACAALLVLRGHGEWEKQLRVIGDDDVRVLNERTLTTEEKVQNEHWAELGGAFIEGGVARAAGLVAREGSHTLLDLAYARAKRLSEEVRLLCEEMQRTIAFEWTEAEKWERLAQEEMRRVSPELTEGRRTYAAEYAVMQRQTCADVYLGGTAVLDGESLVTIELELGDELNPEDEEAQLEAEDD